METREQLTEELRQLEGSMRTLTPVQERRVQQIARILRECRCRECGRRYDRDKSRADYQGFCSAKCLHTKARSFGYRPRCGQSEFKVLKAANCVGSVYTCE